MNRPGSEVHYTLHDLRKSLGVKLAEADATTRQLMEALGHDDIQHAELYSREASQVRLAVQGMEKVLRLEGRVTRLGKRAGQTLYKLLENKGFGGPGGTRTPNQAVMSRRL